MSTYCPPLAPVPSECSGSDESLEAKAWRASLASPAAAVEDPLENRGWRTSLASPGAKAVLQSLPSSQAASVAGSLLRVPRPKMWSRTNSEDAMSSGLRSIRADPHPELTMAVRQVKELEIISANLELRLSRAEAARDENEAEIIKVRTENAELSDQLKRMEQERDSLRSRVVSLEATSEEITSARETSQSEALDADRKVGDLRKKLKAAESRAKMIQKDLEESRAKATFEESRARAAQQLCESRFSKDESKDEPTELPHPQSAPVIVPGLQVAAWWKPEENSSGAWRDDPPGWYPARVVCEQGPGMAVVDWGKGEAQVVGIERLRLLPVDFNSGKDLPETLASLQSAQNAYALPSPPLPTPVEQPASGLRPLPTTSGFNTRKQQPAADSPAGGSSADVMTGIGQPAVTLQEARKAAVRILNGERGRFEIRGAFTTEEAVAAARSILERSTAG